MLDTCGALWRRWQAAYRPPSYAAIGAQPTTTTTWSRLHEAAADFDSGRESGGGLLCCLIVGAQVGAAAGSVARWLTCVLPLLSGGWANVALAVGMGDLSVNEDNPHSVANSVLTPQVALIDGLALAGLAYVFANRLVTARKPTWAAM